ncbi:MAG TPA: hypothetical protein VFD31_12680, partial [Thermoleophilaceae bacterium]|nr:hypothetical protein [Thermoleophilaceae bacterium]
MRRGVTLAALADAIALAVVPTAGAQAPTGGPVRVEILSRSQQAVARGSRVRVRVSSRRKGLVRLGGRVVTFPSGRRRVVRLTRRRVLKLKRGTRRTLLLRLLVRGRREVRRAKRVCGGSRIQVFGLYDARRKARDVGKGRTVRYRAQGRSLSRDLRRCLKGAAPGAGGDGYRVGVAARDINPAADGRFEGGTVNLGGYGIGAGRGATGILGDGIKVRAFAVSDGRNSFAIADIETQGWFTATKDGPYGLVDIRKTVQQRTSGGLKASQVVVQSDHSHSGPDTIGVWGGVPVGYRKLIADRTVDAIAQAFNTMRPGGLFYGTAPGRDLLSNQFDYDEQNKVVDSDVRVLQAREPSGRPFATLMNFSAHTTVLGSSNRKVSGDWVQPANPLLADRFGGEAVTVVGTLGRTQPADRGCDTAPLPPAGERRDLCSIRSYAERVVERAEDAAVAARPVGPTPVVAARSYLIQDPATNALILGLNAAGDAATVPVNRALTPPWLTGNVVGTVTASARIGDVLLSSMPGEAYPQIPLKVGELVKPRGHMTAGLANDQLGYLIAPYQSYPEPIRRSFFNQRGDEVSPIDNDNYFFNVSTTMGERVTCSLLRGAGEVFGRGGAARGAHQPCGAFPNDELQPAGADVGGG